MRFWDSSAVVPLLAEQPASAAVVALLRDDPRMVAWWGTPIECTSAVARAERDGALGARAATESLERLGELRDAWLEILPTEAVRTRAERLLLVHPLRAGDAVQLAAALTWRGDPGAEATVVTLDARLADAARREGLGVLPGP